MATPSLSLVGKKAPAFSAHSDLGSDLITHSDSDLGQKLSLKDFKGSFLVLFFYPKDMTSGCTVEARDFEKLLPQFKKAGAKVVGVSRDPLKSHAKFREKEGLSYDLLSDEEGQVTEAYGVWVQKSMYGRKYMGIERSTFLIGPDGKVLAEWRKVKVPGHADAVLAKLRELC